MSDKDIYSTGILRVTTKAFALGITLPHYLWHREYQSLGNLELKGDAIFKTRFAGALMDHIEDPNIRYVFRLIDAQKNPPDWHSIEYPESCVLSRYENSEAARSKAIAVQHVQDLAKQEDLAITEESCINGSIRYYADDEWVATIAKIRFEETDDKLIKKAVSVLKLSTSIHDEECLHRILSPLLSPTIIRPGCVKKHSELKDYFTYSTLNNLAAAVKKAFYRLDTNISLGHAQELLAAFFNYPSWNHLRAVEKSCEGIAINPAMVLVHHKGKAVYHYFRNDSQALAYFSTLCNKGSPYDAKVNSTYGSIHLRQPPQGEHTLDAWPNSDSEDNAIVMRSLWQVDRYDVDHSLSIGTLGGNFENNRR